MIFAVRHDMNKIDRFFAAAILLFPSLLLIWWTGWHLWYVYGSVTPTAFGLNIPIGGVEIRDPWSDVLIFCCAITAVGSAITLRLDHDVVAWFRSAGRGYQTKMNAVLRSYMSSAKHA